MIETYNANRDTQIKDGKVTVSFGFSVEGVTQADARHVEKEIDLFLARVAAPQRTSTTLKHFAMVPWSDKEKETVRVALSKEDAWTRYQAAFPDSSRSKSTVTRWWDQYHETPKDTPPGSISEDPLTDTEKEADRQAAKAREEIAGKKSQAKAKKPAPVKKNPGKKKRQGNKFGIPTELAKSDIKKYQRLWARCVKHGIMYEAALEMEAPAGKKSKSPQRKVKETVKKKAVKVRKPAEPPVKRSDPLVDGIVTGVKVQQVKPVDGKMFFGTGTVTSRHGDLVQVSNGGGKKYTLDVSLLALVPVKEPAPVQETAENVVPSGPAVGQEYSLDTESGKTTLESTGAQDTAPPAEDAAAPDHETAPDDAPPAEDPAPSNGRYKVGDLVRQTGGSAIFTGTGKVKRAPQGRPEILIQFDNGMEWISRDNLAKVTA